MQTVKMYISLKVLQGNINIANLLQSSVAFQNVNPGSSPVFWTYTFFIPFDFNYYPYKLILFFNLSLPPYTFIFLPTL